MAEQQDFTTLIGEFVAIGAIDHMLKIPVEDAATEAAILERLAASVPPPVIRFQSGAYGFAMDPSIAETVCEALAEFEGTLEGLDLETEGPMTDGLRAVVDAACACAEPPILTADFALSAATILTGTATEPTTRLPAPEPAASGPALSDALDEIGQRVSSLEKVIAALNDRPAAELPTDEIAALSREIHSVAGHKTLLERIETLMVDLVASQSAADNVKFEPMINTAMHTIEASIYKVGERSLETADAIRVDMMSCLQIIKKLDDEMSNPERAADRKAIRAMLSKIVSPDSSPMSLIGEGKKLTRISSGLQRVLDRMKTQIEDPTGPCVDSELQQDLEIKLAEMLTAQPESPLRQAMSENTIEIAALLAKTAGQKQDNMVVAQPAVIDSTENTLPDLQVEDEANNPSEIQQLLQPGIGPAIEGADLALPTPESVPALEAGGSEVPGMVRSDAPLPSQPSGSIVATATGSEAITPEPADGTVDDSNGHLNGDRADVDMAAETADGQAEDLEMPTDEDSNEPEAAPSDLVENHAPERVSETEPDTPERDGTAAEDQRDDAQGKSEEAMDNLPLQVAF